MKITFVTTYLTVFGGGGKFLRDYANKFYENGHQVTIIAQKIDCNNYKFNKEITLIEVGGPLPSNPLYWFLLNKIKKKYLDILNKLNIDLAISIHFPCNYFCLNMNKRKGLKHVHYCLEPYQILHDKKYYSNAPIFTKILLNFFKLFFMKYDIKGTIGADEIVCISNFTRKRVKKIYRSDSYLHYIGVDIDTDTNEFNQFDLEKKLKLKQNIQIIFTLGLTSYKKGARELMFIFDKIFKEVPDTILLIGGSILKENRIIIKKLIKKLKIPQKNVLFYGFIKENELNGFYAKTTLTIYTAIDESYGLIPLESMKNGTPVIAFEGGGPSETIINGQTGYLIKYGEFDKFAQKAISLMKDKKLHKRFSKNAKEFVRKNFNIEESVLNLEKIFQNIISKL